MNFRPRLNQELTVLTKRARRVVPKFDSDPKSRSLTKDASIFAYKMRDDSLMHDKKIERLSAEATLSTSFQTAKL